jgi:hypothetical protein
LEWKNRNHKSKAIEAKMQSEQHFSRRQRALCHRKKGTYKNLGGPGPPWPLRFLRHCRGCFFSNKLKMARAWNLKRLIVFWVNRCKICWVFNYCTKFQFYIYISIKVTGYPFGVLRKIATARSISDSEWVRF